MQVLLSTESFDEITDEWMLELEQYFSFKDSLLEFSLGQKLFYRNDFHGAESTSAFLSSKYDSWKATLSHLSEKLIIALPEAFSFEFWQNFVTFSIFYPIDFIDWITCIIDWIEGLWLAFFLLACRIIWALLKIF